MSYKININDFEGPLDLLLFFIQRDKLNIYDIPISKISNDFLNYISALNNMNIEVGAEFIYMASILMKIKSNMLLPRDESEFDEIVDPRHHLMLKLIEYKKFKKVSRHLLDIGNDYSNRYKTKIIHKYKDSDSKTSDTYMGNFNLYDIIKMYAHLIEKIPDKNSYKLDSQDFSTATQIKLIKNKIKSAKINNKLFNSFEFTKDLEKVYLKLIKTERMKK